MSQPSTQLNDPNKIDLLTMNKSNVSPPTNPINKSQSAQDVRLGVCLRRVTPPKCTVTVKKNETPLANVVLRKVEKKLLEPPKPIKHEKSPPPKKLPSDVTNAGVAVLKAKKTKSTKTTVKQLIGKMCRISLVVN